MGLVISHPTGNANVRAVISALFRAQLLVEFNTTIAINPDALLLNFIPQKVRNELLRRTYTVPQEQLWSHPILEVARILLQRVGLDKRINNEKHWASIDSVYQNFDKAVALRLEQLSRKHCVNAVYAYEDGGLDTFLKARAMGIKCIYDLPIAYWETGRRLMLEEYERLPRWAVTLGGGVSDSQVKLERKTQELELADVVVTPSQFVLDSIPEWAKRKKVILSPFGSPALPATGFSRKDFDVKRPLRVLFVGSLGQRKGLGDLFAAAKLIKNAPFELVVMGSLLAPMDFYRNEYADFIFEPGRPHEQVLELMRTCDVLCLPSVVEGRALVMQEAMSQGLPLIITPNTGGVDLIVEGETGFLVPVGAPEVIAEKILWFIQNRSALPTMSKLAKEKAKSYTWENYGDTIVEAITPCELEV